MEFKRGDIYYVSKEYTFGCEQQSGRPAVIVSNDKNNKNSEAVEVVYLTTQPKKDLPTHVSIRSGKRDSTALCEQITTVSTGRLLTYYGTCSKEELTNIDIAMMISLDLQMSQKEIVEVVKEVPVEVYDQTEVEKLKAEIRELTVKNDTLQQMYEGLIVKLMTR